MKVLAALALLVWLANQQPIRLSLARCGPSAGPDTCPICEAPMSDHHVCKEPSR